MAHEGFSCDGGSGRGGGGSGWMTIMASLTFLVTLGNVYFEGSQLIPI